MKLLRYGSPGAERPGLLDVNGQLRDLGAHIPDLAGAALGRATLDRLHSLDLQALPLVQGSPRIGPCVGEVGKIIGVGLNYRDHAIEANAPIPSEPPLFMKATSAIIGPNDNVEIPRGSAQTDWEVELGIVIGERCKHVPEHEAIAHIAGYCVVNDISERAWQLERGGQWDKGKGCDTFAPLGPWLVTADEILDPQELDLWLEVDGHRYQGGHTSQMIFGVAYLVAYISQFMTLHPGDVITTGTPAGVGLGRKPPVFLRSGQTMRLGITGLGAQEQHVVAAGESSSSGSASGSGEARWPAG